MLRLLALILGTIAVASPCASQDKKQPTPKKAPPPKVLYSVPLVVKAGEKQKLALRGMGLAEVKEVKVIGVEEAKVKVLGAKAVPVPNNYPDARIGNSEVEVELELPKPDPSTGAKPGPIKLVAIGAGGESTPYTLLARDELPVVLEKEPNEGFDQAQAITVPCAIEGTIKSERDVDVFKFEGKKGDKLRIEVQAARYGSPLEAMVMLYDAGRRVLDGADETTGKPDPVLTVTLQRDGTFYLSILDVNDLGGANFGYRLKISR